MLQSVIEDCFYEKFDLLCFFGFNLIRTDWPKKFTKKYQRPSQTTLTVASL